MIKIIVASTEDITIIQQLAYAIWTEVYSTIISAEQIEYMLDTRYNIQSLKKQMKDGQQFFIAKDGTENVGYAAVAPTNNPERFKLEKLYVVPDIHKKGIGKMLLEAVEHFTKEHKGKVIELQVNRQNNAVRFYQKMQFEIEKEVDVSIGEGYYMNDYIMIKSLTK